MRFNELHNHSRSLAASVNLLLPTVSWNLEWTIFRLLKMKCQDGPKSTNFIWQTIPNGTFGCLRDPLSKVEAFFPPLVIICWQPIYCIKQPILMSYRDRGESSLCQCAVSQPVFLSSSTLCTVVKPFDKVETTRDLKWESPNKATWKDRS